MFKRDAIEDYYYKKRLKAKPKSSCWNCGVVYWKYQMKELKTDKTKYTCKKCWKE